MYDRHDMSSHEVVVRSLLEVLQEFGEASESEREVRSIFAYMVRCADGRYPGVSSGFSQR